MFQCFVGGPGWSQLDKSEVPATIQQIPKAVKVPPWRWYSMDYWRTDYIPPNSSNLVPERGKHNMNWWTVIHRRVHSSSLISVNIQSWRLSFHTCCTQWLFICYNCMAEEHLEQLWKMPDIFLYGSVNTQDCKNVASFAFNELMCRCQGVWSCSESFKAGALPFYFVLVKVNKYCWIHPVQK